MIDLNALGSRAKAAQRLLAKAGGNAKTQALKAAADAIDANRQSIIDANKTDIENGRNNGLNEGLIDRLTLTDSRIDGIIDSIKQIAASPDPVGRILWGEARPNGLKIQKVSVPLGVIAVIYESRPNVTADAAALCLKAGNAVILKGGKEAINSNKAIADTMRGALEKSGLPADCIILIEDNAREVTNALMTLNEYVDVLIPRGGAGLIKSVVQNSTVPVIETGVGNCHTYIDSQANIDMAVRILVNAKTSRVSVCNACESLLVHKDIAEIALLAAGEALKEKGVTIKGDEAVCAVLPYAEKADGSDWGREYLDYIISAKVVSDIDEAIDHINKYGTGHSECIVTESYENANRFTSEIDAAAVYVNASTRFTDGGEFGFGAEIGISTQKLHARGPLGLANLVAEKYIVCGDGQIR
ncbi:MAG: glutamate-5-semialdehyde dehydrogenase [Clostridia bacterium]|nr:glutamate-5-semialdehyde dehydrogenase [Clostridia bacterium]